MPTHLLVLLTRLRALVRRDAVAGEIHDELEFHMQMRIEEYERTGMTRRDAERTARGRIGNISIHQDNGYDVRGGGIMETILQDVRYTFRMWRKQPGFAATAILTLAVGIGLSTALFSVIDAALLRPLPFPHPEQLVSLTIELLDRPAGRGTHDPSIVDARDLRTTRVTTAASQLRPRPTELLADFGGVAERISVAQMTDGALDVFQRPAAIGRAFTEPDVAINAPRVALIGYGFWQSHFGGSPDVLGKNIRFINSGSTLSAAEGSAVIIGVAPQNFYSATDVWLPPSLRGNFGPGQRSTGASVYARLRSGVTLNDAAAELTAIAVQRAAERGEPTNFRVRAASLLSGVRKDAISTISLLSYAVAFIVIIACINVAGLLLARGTSRLPELAIRASIGAGRGRLIRQLLTESLMLGGVSACIGCVLAWWSLDALVSIVPLKIPTTTAATLNYSVLGAALLLAMIAAIGFGLLPAVKLSKARIAGFNVNRGQVSTLTRRTGQWLIGVEVALALIVLAATGLFVRSLMRILSTDVGFNPAAVIALNVTPIDQTPDETARSYQALFDKLRAIPGVAAVGAINAMPMGTGSLLMTGASVNGGPRTMMESRNALTSYYGAIGQPVVQGRLPDLSEIDANRPMVVLNESAAKKLFGASNAVGETLNLSNRDTLVVAVVRDVAQSGPLWAPEPDVHTLLTDRVTGPMTVVVRQLEGAHVPLDVIRKTAADISAKVLIEQVRTGTDALNVAVATPRHRTALFALLGGTGLALALVGIFATTAYAVATRTREIGVRMTFGARPAQVVRTVLADAALPIGLGSIAGLGLAALSTKVIAKFLFQTTPMDAAALGSVAIILIASAVVAAWLPARRAARVDPVTALRAE